MVSAWQVILVVICGGTVFHAGLHALVHGSFNVHQAALAFFLVINVLVNFWELALHACADQIRREYEETKIPYKGRVTERVNEVMTKRIPLNEVFRFHHWTGIWSSYALFDPGYADRRAFGWNIDVGNGWSTVLPALLTAFGMTFEIIPARALGIIGIAMYWQMLYGTIVYFFQFFNNRCHVGYSKAMIASFVGSSNGLWFIFPIWGLWLSTQLIYADSYAILR